MRLRILLVLMALGCTQTIVEPVDPDCWVTGLFVTKDGKEYMAANGEAHPWFLCSCLDTDAWRPDVIDAETCVDGLSETYYEVTP